MRRYVAILLLAGFAPAQAPADDAAAARAIVLNLENGAGAGQTMTLEFAETGGRWGEEVWGRAPEYNFAHHRGAYVRASDCATVTLAVESDLVAPGGKAEYRLRLKQEGTAFGGVYEGTFIDEPVTGRVSGAAEEPAVRPCPGFAPPRGGEHPRLIFRAGDLPDLRRRLQTPEGRAIESMLLVRAPLRLTSQVTDRHASWMAANWGAIHQLAGDAGAAAEARRVLVQEVINKPMPADRDDIHHAPRLLGVALAYDLCHDAWDETFRRYLADYILLTADELYRCAHEGLPMPAGTVDPTPWLHRNAVRMACVGVAALAVLDDPGTDGKPLAGAARLAQMAERHVAAYLREGITGAGVCMEGPTVKSIALANGILQFMQASRTAAGRDLSGVNPWLLAGQIVTAAEIGAAGYRFGLSSISVQASGRWSMGLGSAPDRFLGAMKWCFDRDCGLRGSGHFDIAYPYQAACALRNYPFDAAAVEPGTGLPLFVMDRVHGQFVFRSRWQDADDVLAVLDINLAARPGVDPRVAPDAGALCVRGLGREWIKAPVGLAALARGRGGALLYAETGRPGQACVGANLDALYRQPERAPARRPPSRRRGGVVSFVPAAFPETKDIGLRCTRHFAVDYSGASGAPGLFVIVDRIEGAGTRPWYFTAGEDPARPTVIGDPGGANLTWQFASGVSPRRGAVEARDPCFAVLTLGNGPAPAARIEGAGTAAMVTIGGQTVSFDGKRIVFAK